MGLETLGQRMAMTEVDKTQATPKAEWLKTASNPVTQAAPNPQWTLWEEANSMMSALDRVAAHVRHTRGELERNLIELERLIGVIPKRP